MNFQKKGIRRIILKQQMMDLNWTRDFLDYELFKIPAGVQHAPSLPRFPLVFPAETSISRGNLVGLSN